MTDKEKVEYPLGGKHTIEIEESEATTRSAEDESEDAQGSEAVLVALQQVDYDIRQQTEVLSCCIGIGLGLLVGIIFSVWFSKIWNR